ncbi:probable nucleoside diphosphate kinase 5 isoform X2 [Phragmites australis]|uniref:probable nucleoside diphosphate kinase 5 isoform X2 n=1 Tax=Phragmites australis TaxID=29695 RepID=UPI002D76B1D8|nr:probable nucleoside diphosphate kinase 5 isoform X2 [Phragmites australis]
MAGATSQAARSVVIRWLPPLLLLFHGCWSCGAVERERTLAMIKPDGLSGNYTEKIKEAVLESGFDIVKEAEVKLDAERASLFYAEHSGRSFFDSLVKYMTSIRAMCGLDSEKNCVHGSDSMESAAREISFFFGDASSETVEHDEL